MSPDGGQFDGRDQLAIQSNSDVFPASFTIADDSSNGYLAYVVTAHVGLRHEISLRMAKTGGKAWNAVADRG